MCRISRSGKVSENEPSWAEAANQLASPLRTTPARVLLGPHTRIVPTFQQACLSRLAMSGASASSKHWRRTWPWRLQQRRTSCPAGLTRRRLMPPVLFWMCATLTSALTDPPVHLSSNSCLLHSRPTELAFSCYDRRLRFPETRISLIISRLLLLIFLSRILRYTSPLLAFFISDLRSSHSHLWPSITFSWDSVIDSRQLLLILLSRDLSLHLSPLLVFFIPDLPSSHPCFLIAACVFLRLGCINQFSLSYQFRSSFADFARTDPLVHLSSSCLLHARLAELAFSFFDRRLRFLETRIHWSILSRLTILVIFCWFFSHGSSGTPVLWLPSSFPTWRVCILIF